MKPLTANQMAGLLPVALFLHQVEEFHTNFPLVFSNYLGVQLSDQDFITINGVGLFIVSVLSLSYFFHKNNFILVALGSVLFVNGVVHTLVSLFTFSYMPGLITGAVLLLPLGFLVFRLLLLRLTERNRVLAIASGVVALISVSLIAMNM